MASFGGSLGVVAFGFLAAGWALGCGPSMRTLVESDMRFERCYRIDDDSASPLEDKRRCWREWTARYTKGQERSRVAYAEERLRLLDGVPTGATATGPGPTTAVVACPSPASPYAPPPPIARPSAVPSAGSSGESQSVNATTSAASAPACGQTCTDAWRGCIVPCGSATGCVVECDVRFKDCMKSCL